MCWLEIRKVARSSISADVVDVRNLRAADALIDPAHDIAKNTLRVVVEFLLDFLGRPVDAAGKRDSQNIVEACARGADESCCWRRKTLTL